MQPAQAFTIAGLGALLGGVLGGLVTVWLTDSPSPKLEKEQAAASASADEDEPVDVEGRVAALERAVGRLRSGARVAPATPVASGAPGEPGAKPAAVGDPVVDSPVFEAAVRDLLDRVQEERDSEREIERGEQRRQWSAQWANELAGSLKLSDVQKTKMQEIANQFWERLREYRNSDAGARPSRDERRQQMGALRDEAESKMSQVLDPTQMKSYKELEDDQRLGARFGREFRRRSPDQ